MFTRHLQSIIVIACILVMALLVTNLSTSVSTPPTREAYIKSGDQWKKLKIHSVAALSDAKLINFAERVIITCFSLTPLNYVSKSEFCRNQYFSYNAGLVYQRKYAEIVGRQISEDEGTRYATGARKPVIVAPWEKNNYQYYVLVFPIKLTNVLRTSRVPESRLVQLWITPLQKSNNPFQFEIIGIRL
ncbi:hypothetical protein [Vibrio coralliilyticus]|uniref:hypothetical protein n=1 Tax=Vibrio coralliilyticus TaxID=190893 RepID=UPI001E287C0A|nr:hypothetical protein [Vibrio coralliilyticus]MCC2524967.1 hypothetical protein [Vibrio coralliilyticus]